MVCVVEQGLGSGVTATTNVPLPTLHPWRPRHPHTRGHSLPPATPLPTPRPLHHRVYFPPTAFFIPNVRATVRCHDIAPTLRGARAVVARASKLCVVVMLLECWTCVFEVLSVETRSVAGDLLVLRNKKRRNISSTIPSYYAVPNSSFYIGFIVF